MNEELSEEISEKDIDLAREIMKTVTKTVKAVTVYPKDNPVYKKFAGELFEKFSSFFESNDELAFDIQQYTLTFKGNEVFHSEDRNDNPALLLYADGLRQISFQKGITVEEINDFIDILRRNPKSEAADDDDIVTLLWAKNIRNMGYTAVEDTVDDDLAVEESLIFDETGDYAEGEPAAAPGEAGEPAAAAEAGGGPVAVSSVAIGIGAPDEEDLKRLGSESQAMDDSTLLSSAVGLFLEMLSGECDSDSFPVIVLNLGKIMDIMMQKKDISGALEISRGLEKVSSMYDSPKNQEMIGDVLARAGSLENLVLLFNESKNPGEIKEYLLRLGPRALPNMIELLGELQDRRQRKFLCDILAELGKRKISAFADFMADGRWYLIRNIAMILGMTKDPESAQHLGKALQHTDVRVRREAVRGLDNIHSGETKRFFVAALQDHDQTTRMTALKAIRRWGDPALFKFIRDSVSAEIFRKRPFIEKKELLETLAVLGRSEAFTLLEDMFRKKGLLEKDETTEVRAAAAYGLAVIGTPEAITLIEKETGSRKDILRESCIRALKEARKR